MTPTLLEPHQHQQLRNLRLLSLKLDPDAFLSTYEYESQYPEHYFRQKIYQSLQAPCYGFYGIFQPDLIATAQLSPMYLQKQKHLAKIYELYVHPDFRHQGLAKKLLNYLIKKARLDPQLEAIHLSVVSTNKPAISLYTSLGFQHLVTLPDVIKQANNQYVGKAYYYLPL